MSVEDEVFIHELARAVPEAFAQPDLDLYLEDDALAYPALGHVLNWIADRASTPRWRDPLRRSPIGRNARPALERFWHFVERQAVLSERDTDLWTLLRVQIFERDTWDEMLPLMGPSTLRLRQHAVRQ